MGESAPWIKLWCDYTSTTSHDECDGIDLWVGVVLMLLIRAGNGSSPEETPWALQETGSPYTVAGIATRARHTPARTLAALRKLMKAGTVAQREDGAWGMPKFWSFQRSSSKERTRRWRDRLGDTERDTSVTPHGVTVTPESVTLDVQIASLPRSLRFRDSPSGPPAGDTSATDPPGTESLGEAADVDRSFTLAAASKPKRRRKPRLPRTDLPDGMAEHVLTTLRAACVELSGPAAGPRHDAAHPPFVDALAKIHAAHAPTPDEWTTVIRHRLGMDQRGEGFGSLTWESLCAPKNFARWLHEARLPARKATSPTNRGRAEPSPRPTTGGLVDLAELARNRRSPC